MTMSPSHRDEHGDPLDPTTELLFADAAELCGTSTKTLARDEKAKTLEVSRRDGRRYVTVQALIDAGRFKPGVAAPGEIRELSALREEVDKLRVRNAELTALLAHDRDTLRRSDEAVKFLQRIVDKMTAERSAA
jgi:hypothetical protein